MSLSDVGRQPPSTTHPLTSPSKVPRITVFFWIAKILSTAMGEGTSDYLVHRLGGPVAVPIGGLAFAVVLVAQLSARRYHAGLYWLTVGMVGVFGTMAADVLHVGLGVPYVASTTLYAVVLAVVFLTWRRSEGTLSIHSITNRRREIFYWATVLATFALGTAAGDFSATTLHLGYLGAGILFASVFVVPGVAYRFTSLNGIFAFWCAYVLTRPLGASFADYMGKPTIQSGLGFSLGAVAIWLAVALGIVVVFLMISRIDTPADLSPS